MNPSQKIVQSWYANAAAWVATIERGDLESRVLVTNQAVVEAVLASGPKKVLDIGCGEGWLCRALRDEGVGCWGVDAVPQLVEKAIEKGGAFYEVHAYEEITTDRHRLPKPFDVAVFNFSLLDEQASAQIIKYTPRVLNPQGHVVIQTLHPSSVAKPEITGWKDGSWTGMKQTFVQPYHWFYRTTADWVQLFTDAGMQVLNRYEPLHPHSGKPVSIIFVLQVNHT